jgi:ribosomal protein L40E
MGSHIQVPLKHLRFGHEAPKHPSNARVTGRLEGIETLAVNIHSRGLIEDLIVFDDGVPPLYFVSDGNRSLAALRLIYGEDSGEMIDCKPRPAEQAFEDSLAVAVLAHKLHPIDEFEGFARLRDDHGKTEEEIARQYGMTERGVQQVLALGHLSPKIREAWRNCHDQDRPTRTAFDGGVFLHRYRSRLFHEAVQRRLEYDWCERCGAVDPTDADYCRKRKCPVLAGKSSA